jgi:hypothetical protein
MFLFHIRIDSLLTAVASCAQVYKFFVGMFLFLVFSALASYTLGVHILHLGCS